MIINGIKVEYSMSVERKIIQELSEIMGETSIDGRIANAVIRGKGKNSKAIITVESDNRDYTPSFQIADDLVHAINAIGSSLGIRIYVKSKGYSIIVEGGLREGYDIVDTFSENLLFDVSGKKTVVEIKPVGEKLSEYSTQQILNAYVLSLSR